MVLSRIIILSIFLLTIEIHALQFEVRNGNENAAIPSIIREKRQARRQQQNPCPNNVFVQKHVVSPFPNMATASRYAAGNYKLREENGWSLSNTLNFYAAENMAYNYANGVCTFATKATKYVCDWVRNGKKNVWQCRDYGRVFAEHPYIGGHHNADNDRFR